LVAWIGSEVPVTIPLPAYRSRRLPGHNDRLVRRSAACRARDPKLWLGALTPSTSPLPSPRLLSRTFWAHSVRMCVCLAIPVCDLIGRFGGLRQPSGKGFSEQQLVFRDADRAADAAPGIFDDDALRSRQSIRPMLGLSPRLSVPVVEGGQDRNSSFPSCSGLEGADLRSTATSSAGAYDRTGERRYLLATPTPDWCCCRERESLAHLQQKPQPRDKARSSPASFDSRRTKIEL